jgi:uncharacterized membrane protein (GlpM family)
MVGHARSSDSRERVAAEPSGSGVRDYLLRFLGAGLLVASVPWVASQFSDRAAGVVLLFPAVTLSGFLVLGLERGTPAVASASASAVFAVPTVVVFLIAVHVAARLNASLPLVLAVGVTAWLLTAIILVPLGRYLRSTDEEAPG